MRLRDAMLRAGLGAVFFGLIVASPADARKSGRKRASVKEIIVHATGGPSCRRGKVVFSAPGTVASMERFFAQSRRVSIHYIVGRKGRIAKSVPENQVAIHARRHNRNSIGIELINRGDGIDRFPEAQMAALVTLVRGIQQRHAIPLAAIKGHEEVDASTFRCRGRFVRRKQDPGPRFEWDRFRFNLLLAGA